MATDIDNSNVKIEGQSGENNGQTIIDDDQPELRIKDEPMTDQSQGNNNNNINNDDDNNNNEDEHRGANDDGDNERMDNEESANRTTRTNNEPIEEHERTNLIVNYLPQQMTDEQFEELFKKYGVMKSCKIVRNRNTSYSYGFGFVDYESHEQALRAIDELNGYEVDTKKIKVAFARPAGQDIKQANLYVKGVPSSWTQDDVKKVFEPYGQIIQVRVLSNDRGIAFVLFDLRKQAEEAMEALNGKTVEGLDAPFEIKFAADKKGEKRGNSNGNNNRQQGRQNNNQGRRGGQERGNRGGRSLSNNRNNRSNSNQRGRGISEHGRGNGRNMYQKNNNNGNNNGGSNYNDQMNGGNIGPMRQQPGNRMNRYAPFTPMTQAPMQAAAAGPGMMPYGYPPQPMMQYMMPNQMMQMGHMASHPQQQQQQQAMQMAGHPMNPYAQLGYAQPTTMTQPSAVMSNMYNMASSTMTNAAQMQPQLGQPMSMRGPGFGGNATSTAAVVGGGSVMSGSGVGTTSSSGNQSSASDGVTLFVYNIGPNSDEDELKTLFSPFGDVVRSNVVRKTPGGETKGFGFVTLRSRDQASAAIAALNGQMRNGKPLQVSFKK